MESVILTVRQLLIDGRAVIAHKGAYSENEAKVAFKRVAIQHGWIDKRVVYLKLVLSIFLGASFFVMAAGLVYRSLFS